MEKDNWEIESDNDFVEGVQKLMKTFNSVLNILLNTSNVKFTTGVYVDYFRGFNHENKPEGNGGIYLLRDDFEFDKNGKIKNLLENNNQSGIILEVQTGIRASLNNGSFINKEIPTKQSSSIVMIAKNIPDLRNEKEKGVLFIFTKSIEEVPEDLESVLSVFCSLISHWLELYNHQVIQRQISFGGDIEEEEEIENEE